MEKQCTGVFLMFKLLMEDEIRLWALKNFGLVTPPLVPSPSHQRAPSPSMTWPGSPVTEIPVPETEIRGPDHSA